MSNAFNTTGPSQIKFKQKSVKQIRQDATRKNKFDPMCSQVPVERAQKLRKAVI